MSDSDRRVPQLVGPDGHTPASMKNVLHNVRVDAKKPLTEARAAELIEAGVIAGLKNIVEHFQEHNSAHMELMEAAVTSRVLAELEARSFRGRIRRWWRGRAIYGYLCELGVIDPVPRLEVQSGGQT